VANALQSAGANVEESRMTILGNDFAILLRVTTPDTQTPAALLELMQKSFPDFVVSSRNTTTHPIFTSPVRIFSVAVEGPDQPGIVSVLSKLFVQHKGSIRDLDTDTSNAPFAGYKVRTSERSLGNSNSHFRSTSIQRNFMTTHYAVASSL